MFSDGERENWPSARAAGSSWKVALTANLKRVTYHKINVRLKKNKQTKKKLEENWSLDM